MVIYVWARVCYQILTILTNPISKNKRAGAPLEIYLHSTGAIHSPCNELQHSYIEVNVLCFPVQKVDAITTVQGKTMKKIQYLSSNMAPFIFKIG